MWQMEDSAGFHSTHTRGCTVMTCQSGPHLHGVDRGRWAGIPDKKLCLGM